MIGTVASDSTLLMTVGLPNRPLMRRQRRLGAHQPALALEAFEQRGFLAADIGAGADADFEVEAIVRTRDLAAEHAAALRRLDRLVHARRSRCGYSERQ